MYMHIYSIAFPTHVRQTAVKLIKLPCYCGSIRQASRLVTQLYDRALKPAGLKITQFGILRVLGAQPGLTTGELAESLAMDSTTMTRTLKLIHDAGWISMEPGTDRRERRWTVTPSGRERTQAALPLWKNAQKELANLAGDADLDLLTETVFRLAKKSQQQFLHLHQKDNP